MTCVKQSTDSYRSPASIGRDGTREASADIRSAPWLATSADPLVGLAALRDEERWNEKEVNTHRYL